MKRYTKEFATIDNYDDWLAAAERYDKRHKLDRWRAKEESDLYDYRQIKKRLEKLRELRQQGDDAGLLFTLNEGIHGNMGGMGKGVLYRKAKGGTKTLIEDYINEISDALVYLAEDKNRSFGFEEKYDFFRRARHCFGCSAMMFSGGGNLIYFHYGVAKTLIQQQLLPTVLSGASAGAMLCAIIGTHSDEDLLSLMEPHHVNFGDAWEPSFFEKLTGVRRIFDSAEIESSFDRLIPDLTFEEAFKISGRHINISVSPTERHQSSRLLNATASPNVLIRSAVKASCAPPGIVDPVTLYAKNAQGEIVPYLPSRKWQDGSISGDLPAKRLSRLYGVNHYIVSLINPYALEYIKKPKIVDAITTPALAASKEIIQQGLNTIDKVFKNHQFAAIARVLHSLMIQTYRGDINIVLDAKHISPFKLLSPYTMEEVRSLMTVGEKATWPMLEQIRVSSKIGRTLDEILRQYHNKERDISKFYEKHQLKAATTG
jgi:predicted acylesterase/phospholipase RssA